MNTPTQPVKIIFRDNYFNAPVKFTVYPAGARIGNHFHSLISPARPYTFFIVGEVDTDNMTDAEFWNSPLAQFEGVVWTGSTHLDTHEFGVMLHEVQHSAQTSILRDSWKFDAVRYPDYATPALPGGDAGMFPAAHPRPTLDAEYSTWADSLPADDEPETCECGKPVAHDGTYAPDCQCCEDCGRYPCKCRKPDEDGEDDSVIDTRWYGWLKK